MVAQPNKSFHVLNIRDKIAEGSAGEDFLRRNFSTFACQINPDVERFFLERSIDFTKRNQSVSYLVTSPPDEELLGYFTLAIKAISVNAVPFSNSRCDRGATYRVFQLLARIGKLAMRRKIERVSEVNEQTGEYILAAYLIAQLGKNFKTSAKITGKDLLQVAINTIRDLQYMAGGTVIFLETDDVPKLIAFYEANGFKQFAVRKSRGTQEQHKLVQLLKVM